MSEGTRPPMDASALASSGEKMLAGMQARLDALTQPEPQKKGPNFNFSGVKDKLGQAGGWVKNKAGQAGEKVGQVKEKVTTSAKELKEKLQNWQKSPFGKAIETALVDFVKKDLPGTIDKLVKEKNIKKILTLAGLKIAGNTATNWAINKAQETWNNKGEIAKSMWDNAWEKKYDIATGALSGAVLRTLFITAGAEAYIAKAIASGAIAGVRRLDSELAAENKPENLKARLNLIKRLKEYPPEKRKQLARKVAVAGVIGAAGSVIGMELMEHTGLGNFLHEALASGAGKVGEVASGIGSKVAEIRDNLPQINPIEGAKELGSAAISTASETINNVPRPSMPDINLPHPELPNPLVGAQDVLTHAQQALDSAGNTLHSYADQFQHPATAEVGGAPAAGTEPPAMPSEGQPGPIPEGSISNPDVPDNNPAPSAPSAPSTPIEAGPAPATEAAAPQAAAIPDTAPAIDTHAQVIDEAIRNIPPTMPLESGGTPWSVAEHLLKSANPDGNFTPGDIMKVDQELCRLNGVAVPEWGIEGKILATRIPAGFILKTDDENLLNIVKQVASSK